MVSHFVPRCARWWIVKWMVTQRTSCGLPIVPGHDAAWPALIIRRSRRRLSRARGSRGRVRDLQPQHRQDDQHPVGEHQVVAAPGAFGALALPAAAGAGQTPAAPATARPARPLPAQVMMGDPIDGHLCRSATSTPLTPRQLAGRHRTTSMDAITLRGGGVRKNAHRAAVRCGFVSVSHRRSIWGRKCTAPDPGPRAGYFLALCPSNGMMDELTRDI